MLYYDEYGNRDNPTILLLHGAGVLDTFMAQEKGIFPTDYAADLQAIF